MRNAVWARSVVLLAILPSAAMAQVFVYPRHAEKSQVRYYDFEWRHLDILVGPDADKSLADPTGSPPAGTVGTDTRGGSEGPVQMRPGGDRGGRSDVMQPDGGFPQPFLAGNGDGGPTTVQGPTAANLGDGGTPGMQAQAAATGDGGAPSMQAQATAAGDGGLPAAALLPDGGVSPWYVWPTTPDGGVVVPGSPSEGAAQLGPRSGGVRMFFYERERGVAERAAHIILSSYRHLVDVFDFVPTQTFPYILYSSYQEFLQTNLSPLQEGTLGFTQTVGDLSLTLPYFGDHELFSQVSLHEMSHQFTIQKVRFMAQQARLSGDPLENMPLWFIEGLAQFYAMGGIDDEADLLIRDLVTNPDPEQGYALIDFWEDRPYSVLWTYQAGQIRCAFLEETYGAGIIQRILNESPSLVGSGTFRRAAVDFKGLVERLSGDNPQTISKKFEQWLKRRAFKTYLAARQDVPAVELFPEGFAIAGALNASPNGEVVLYRSFEEETGRSRLVLVDPRVPSKSKVVTIDGIPGVESLHPVFGRNFDLTNDYMAYVAEAGGHDRIYIQKYTHSAQKQEMNPAFANPPGAPLSPPGAPISSAPPPPASAQPKELWNVELELGDRVAYNLGSKGLLGAFYPSISPDGKRIAFVAINEQGIRDLYVMEPTDQQGGFNLQQLTHDDYSERQVAWGPKGIVYASDATESGHYNLFLADPKTGALSRLTSEARDHSDPEALADGRILFSAFGDGRADIYEVTGNEIVRRTDIATGLFDLSPGPDGGLWALFHYRGRRHPVQIKRDQLLSIAATPQDRGAKPYTIGRTSLAESKPYSMLDPDNWQLDPPFGYVGAGGSQIVGQVFAQATDRLRNHGLILNAAVLGRFDLTNGVLLYINQERRVTWATGLFQTVAYRFDRTFPNLGAITVSGERFYGAVGSARYPFNPFVYVEGELSLGGMQYFLEQYDRLFLALPELNGTGRDLLTEWNQKNGGARLHSQLTLRFGWDTLRWHPATGPIAGNSFLAELTGATQPLKGEYFGDLRLDGEQYFPIEGRTHIFVRAGFGTSLGGRLAKQFFLSSFDTIRGVPFGSTLLLGSNFFFSTAELQVPLNSVLRLILISDLEAIAGVDAGSVSNDLGKLYDRRMLDLVLGVNFSLGPLIFRLHFARPIDTGGEVALQYGHWVTNFSLGVVGLPGFTMKKPTSSGMNARSPFSPVLR